MVVCSGTQVEDMRLTMGVTDNPSLSTRVETRLGSCSRPRLASGLGALLLSVLVTDMNESTVVHHSKTSAVIIPMAVIIHPKS